MMSEKGNKEFFGEYYYAHGCGRPYSRDPEWMEFFSSLANLIVSEIHPETVLDAGCALGMIVETLRLRGVQAWGVDISSFAIQNVHESVKPYCWIGSVVDPFPRKYDLIVCIEVLEHLPKPDSETALKNICQHTEDILFSSSPEDYKEATHINVQPLEYWAELFARQGFFRDVDFDASIITPWTTRFKQSGDPLPRIIRNYERRYWSAWKENSVLRQVMMDNQSQLELKDALIQDQKDQIELSKQSLVDQADTIHQKNTEIEHLSQRLTEYDQTVKQLLVELHSKESQIAYWVSRWRDIESGIGWRALQKIQHARLSLFPRNSRSEKILYYLLRKKTAASGSDQESLPNGSGASFLSEYHSWIEANEPGTEEIKAQNIGSAKFIIHPTISFLTPVNNPLPNVLRATIESVRAQTYPHWQLCLADGNSSNPEIKDILETYRMLDARIQVINLPENFGISENTNRALEMALGEFIAILDHDDMLAINMLYEVVKQINKFPDADLIYFDEDKLTDDGVTRIDPFFKPDWSPELLISANYLTHSVIRREILIGAGKFDPATDGAQDWDLAFRITEKTNKIHHIPKVLYHWRQASGSTSSQFMAKSWVFENQLTAIKNHLTRRGLDNPAVIFSKPGRVKVKWSTRGEKVSIIVPTKDKCRLLKTCIHSIQVNTAYPNYEIVLVDNNTTDVDALSYLASLRKTDNIQVVRYDEEFNYSKANNIGASHATGACLLFLNNDTEVLEQGWLEELVRWAELDEIGVVGGKLLYDDGTIQHAGIVLGLRGHADHIFWKSPEGYSGIFGSVEWYRNYSAVTAACLMVSKDIFDQAGGFDAAYKLAFGDVDFCMRVSELGYRNLYTPFSRIRHHEGKTRVGGVPATDILNACHKFRSQITAGDPYFNPNLSYSSRIPSLSKPDDEDRAARIERIYQEVSAVDASTIYKLY